MKRKPPIHVSVHWLMKVISILGIAESLWATWFSWAIGETSITPFFIVVALLSGYIAVSSYSTIDADQKTITLTSVPHGQYKINWKEVNFIEKNGFTIVFQGKEKRLAVTTLFAGKGKRELHEFVNEQIKQRKIKSQPLTSILPTQKNTKVSRESGTAVAAK